jgi:hypothetical protein
MHPICTKVLLANHHKKDLKLLRPLKLIHSSLIVESPKALSKMIIGFKILSIYKQEWNLSNNGNLITNITFWGKGIITKLLEGHYLKEKV